MLLQVLHAYVCVTVRHCPTLPVVSYGQWMRGFGTMTGALNTLLCDDGYVTPSDNNSVTVECLVTGSWSIDVTMITCTGINQVILY